MIAMLLHGAWIAAGPQEHFSEFADDAAARARQVNPATLFLIEGTGQAGANAAMCWGDGFITDGCAACGAFSVASPHHRVVSLRPGFAALVMITWRGSASDPAPVPAASQAWTGKA